MKLTTIQTEVGLDGTIRLEIPSDLPPGPVEVMIVVQPTRGEIQHSSDPAANVRSGLFLGRARPGVDVDAALDEADAMWKAKLDGLHS